MEVCSGEELYACFEQKLKKKACESISYLLFNLNSADAEQQQLISKILVVDHSTIDNWVKYLEYCNVHFFEKKAQLQRLHYKAIETIQDTNAFTKLQEDSKFLSIHLNIANLKSKPEEAQQYFDNSIWKKEIGRKFSILYLNWADRLLAMNKVKEAHAALKKGLDADAEPRLILANKMREVEKLLQPLPAQPLQQSVHSDTAGKRKVVPYFDDGQVQFNKKLRRESDGTTESKSDEEQEVTEKLDENKENSVQVAMTVAASNLKKTSKRSSKLTPKGLSGKCLRVAPSEEKGERQEQEESLLLSSVDDKASGSTTTSATTASTTAVSIEMPASEQPQRVSNRILAAKYMDSTLKDFNPSLLPHKDSKKVATTTIGSSSSSISCSSATEKPVMKLASKFSIDDITFKKEESEKDISQPIAPCDQLKNSGQAQENQMEEDEEEDDATEKMPTEGLKDLLARIPGAAIYPTPATIAEGASATAAHEPIIINRTLSFGEAALAPVSSIPSSSSSLLRLPSTPMTAGKSKKRVSFSNDMNNHPVIKLDEPPAASSIPNEDSAVQQQQEVPKTVHSSTCHSFHQNNSSNNSDSRSSSASSSSSRGKGSHSSSSSAGVSENIFQDEKRLITIAGHPYIQLSVLGKGGSSVVHRVISCNQGQIYALKKVEIKEMHEECDEIFDSYLNEIRLLERLQWDKSPYIIELIGYEVSKEEGMINMLLEVGDIDLARLLSQRFKIAKNLDPIFARMIWKEMLLAVNYIHGKHIVHGDLKPANFVVVKGHLKLIDFGIAKAMSVDTTNIYRESQIGTVNYMAPEAIKPTPDCTVTNSDGSVSIKLGRTSDIWSLGCILYQMLYSYTPFAGIKQIYEKQFAITNPDHHISYSQHEDVDAIASIRCCLQRNPKLRSPIDGLLQQPYLQVVRYENSTADTSSSSSSSSSAAAGVGTIILENGRKQMIVEDLPIKAPTNSSSSASTSLGTVQTILRRFLPILLNQVNNSSGDDGGSNGSNKKKGTKKESGKHSEDITAWLEGLDVESMAKEIMEGMQQQGEMAGDKEEEEAEDEADDDTIAVDSVQQATEKMPISNDSNQAVTSSKKRATTSSLSLSSSSQRKNILSDITNRSEKRPTPGKATKKQVLLPSPKKIIPDGLKAQIQTHLGSLRAVQSEASVAIANKWMKPVDPDDENDMNKLLMRKIGNIRKFLDDEQDKDNVTATQSIDLSQWI